MGPQRERVDDVRRDFLLFPGFQPEPATIETSARSLCPETSLEVFSEAPDPIKRRKFVRAWKKEKRIWG
jgi:hypothetical protein